MSNEKLKNIFLSFSVTMQTAIAATALSPTTTATTTQRRATTPSTNARDLRRYSFLPLTPNPLIFQFLKINFMLQYGLNTKQIVHPQQCIFISDRNNCLFFSGGQTNTWPNILLVHCPNFSVSLFMSVFWWIYFSFTHCHLLYTSLLPLWNLKENVVMPWVQKFWKLFTDKIKVTVIIAHNYGTNYYIVFSWVCPNARHLSILAGIFYLFCQNNLFYFYSVE